MRSIVRHIRLGMVKYTILFSCVCQVLNAQVVDFGRDIAPLLTKRCLGCHAGETAEGDLDLAHQVSAYRGGESGIAISPGSLRTSLLWQRVVKDEMPEDKPLPESEKALLRRWIEQGAKWDGGDLDPRKITTDTRAGFDWWSLQPLRTTFTPEVKDKSWPRNPIDYFVLHRLENEGLSPSPEAKDHQLLRRLFFDLVGLVRPESTGTVTKTWSEITLEKHSVSISRLQR